jgi:hypothetical protein
MNELRANNLMTTALESIVHQLTGIENDDLSKAEKNILSIAKEALEQRNKLILGEKKKCC